jgi:hypothetical protein
LDRLAVKVSIGGHGARLRTVVKTEFIIMKQQLART